MKETAFQELRRGAIERGADPTRATALAVVVLATGILGLLIGLYASIRLVLEADTTSLRLIGLLIAAIAAVGGTGGIFLGPRLGRLPSATKGGSFAVAGVGAVLALILGLPIVGLALILAITLFVLVLALRVQ